MRQKTSDPMNFTAIRAFLGAITLLFTVPTVASAQDLLAAQAPIDRKLKAVDSVSLQHLLEREARGDDASQLYSDWNNQYAHCYSSEAVPDSFRIDLRGFAMPTPSRLVTSRFGYRPSFRRVHKGIDVKVYTGDTIYAAFDGRVRVAKYDAGGYGYYILLRHPNGLETIYGHLSKQLVGVDDEVRAGQPIGLGGNTGRSFGSHLHFETRLLGEAIDPALLFDFEAQDVTGDFYTFRKNANRSYTASTQPTNGGSAANNGRSSKKSSGAATGQHYYKVKRGDSLYAISGKLHINVDELCRINRIKKTSKIRPGQILRY